MNNRIHFLLPNLYWRVLAGLLAGALNVLAFAPFGWWPLQIATLAFLFWLVMHAPSGNSSSIIGWAYGFGWSFAGVHWLYISMHRYGGLPSWMAILAVGLLSAVLGLFAALAMGGSTWLKRRWGVANTATALLLLPSAWTLAEWTRGWLFTGFPWVSSGYAHTTGPLAGFAPIVGVYGLAWIAALAAGAVVAGALAGASAKRLIALLAIVPFIAGSALKTVDWTTAYGRPISVRLLQGNVPQEMKFAGEQIKATLVLYHNMVTEVPADLIATPETAIPILSHQLPAEYFERLSAFSKNSSSHIVLGLPVSDGMHRYTNSVIGIAPPTVTGTTPYRYDKHHLVPFGEFIPPGARWFVDKMKIPLSDFSRGPLIQTPFAVQDQWILPNICYEDLFGEEIAAQLAASRSGHIPQATVLLNVSNIAWFGDSIAIPQHLQISQMRAMETGRPMLRATNTGATAVIDPKGKIIAQLPAFERGVLTAMVQGYKGLTPYSLYGNRPIVVVVILFIFLAWFLSRTKYYNPHLPAKTR